MSKCDSYAWFDFTGEGLEPAEITARLGIEPTEAWKKGDKHRNGFHYRRFSRWYWASTRGQEPIWIDKLVDEVIDKFQDKVDVINDIKQRFKLESTLQIILYIDTNQNYSTPALGHDLRTIDFLYRTQSTTDVDIYRYNSRGEE